MFSWDDVPGNDSERLRKHLVDDPKKDWAKDAEINKSSDGKAIILTKENNSLVFKLDKKENMVTLEINSVKTYEYILKEENGKLNIYILFHYRYFLDEVKYYRLSNQKAPPSFSALARYFLRHTTLQYSPNRPVIDKKRFDCQVVFSWFYTLIYVNIAAQQPRQ